VREDAIPDRLATLAVRDGRFECSTRRRWRFIFAVQSSAGLVQMRPIEGKTYWIYIMANGPRGVLYVGMTSDLPGRTWEHRTGAIDGFTKRYGLDRLVYFEAFDDPAEAARRERAMKRWRRDWKIELVEQGNPTWRDLYADVLAEHGFDPI
jgi:putative endonuclease